MAALDYSFIGQEETPDEPGGLDYSFIGQDESDIGPAFNPDSTQSQLVPPPENLSNLDRLSERLMNIQVPAWAGVGEMAARQDPTMEQANKDLKAAGTPLEKRGRMAEYISSLAVKGLVDIADMFTEGDVREEMIEVNNLISSEARATLGNPEMQYTGSGPEKFGMEVAEGATNMIPALVAGWGTKNPGVTLGVMGGQVAGNTYNRYMEETGGDHTKSMLAAKFHTAAEIIPETFPVMAIMRKAGAGQALTRMLEATIGEGAQEMLTSVLQQTYDNAELEKMSLGEAIKGIDWGDVAHDGAIGVFVGGTLATPGTIADIVQDKRGKPDQADNPPELFTPTHTAGGGQPVQVVTKKGQVVPDTYMTESGEVIRDSNAIQSNPDVDPTEFDIAAVIERTKTEIGFDAGIVGSQMEAAEMPTGNIPGPEVTEIPIEEIDVTAPAETGIINSQIEPAPAPTATETEITGTKPVEGSVLAQPIEPAAGGPAVAPADQVAHEEEHATEPVEATGWARATAIEYQTKRPEFGGLILSHRPGDKRGDHKATHYYGEIPKTVDADGMPKDVILNKDYNADADTPIFIASQLDYKTKEFRQNKILAGFENEAAARKGYTEQFGDSFGGIKEISQEEFQKWKQEDGKVPYAPAQKTKTEKTFGPKSKKGAKTKSVGVSVSDYYGTPGARGLNHRFKKGDAGAIKQMADEMADKVLPGQVLVPMPSRSGQADNTLALANEIAKITGNPVQNILKGDARESLYDMKKKGKKAPDFGFVAPGEIPENTLIIDNVYDTGETMAQAQAALGGADYLVHSKVGSAPQRSIGTPGKKVKVNVISTGETLDAKMAVVDASELIASNDLSGNPNPAYPKEIQPRDRKKGSSQLQVQKMANDLKPELLEDNGQANGGAPIIGPDGVVESGNGRTLAIQMAYAQKKADAYRQHLIDNAASYGLTEADIKAMKSPVLVRTRQGDMSFNERAEFARQANQSGTAPMTPVENAQSDAERITDEEMQIYQPSDQGNILAASNQSFLEAFGKRLGDLAVGGLSTADGRWTKQMADRVQAAVFYKAYGDEKLLALTAEEADPDIKNILSALNRAAPAFARARAVHDDLGEMDIISDIVGAIDLIRDAKSKGTSVKQIVDQAGLFGDVDPVIAAVASFIESTTRSAKKMGAGFTEMATFLEAEMKNLTQDSLFDMKPATKADIIEAANKRIKEEYGDEKGIQDLFAQSENQQADSVSPAKPGESGEQSTAEAQAQSVNKPNVVQSGYEIPAANRKADLSVKEEEAVQWDLFAPSDVPTETARQQAADSFFTRYEQVETSTFRTGVDTIENPGQVAHLMAATRKHAQEVFSIVVTDKNNKVVNVIRHSKGTIDGASVYPGVVVGAIASTEGAANVWFSHNHPTGVSRPSDADFNITRVIEKMADGLDINMKGHVVIGAGKYSHFTSAESSSAYVNPQYIPPAVRDKTIPVTERMLRKRNRNAEKTLSGPRPVNDYLNTLFTDTGILLLNNRHAPTGVIAITKPEMKKLRDGHQVKRIFSAIDKTNSSAAIIFDKTSTHEPGDLHEEISNLANFLTRLDIRHLDTFIGGKSLAGSNEHSGSKYQPFFRKETNEADSPYAEMMGRDISYPVKVESTGKVYTVTVDAGVAMQELDTRLKALRELRACI